MRITNLSEEHLDSYCMCLEDWSNTMKDKELGETVLFREILTRDRDSFLEWGISDALYIDEKKVKKRIARQLNHL